MLTYAAMLDRMAAVLGRRPRPRVPVPFITPWLSSLWIGLVTPVDAGVARPLVEGLAVPTVVSDDSGMRLFADVAPMGLDDALRAAVKADREAEAATAERLTRAARGQRLRWRAGRLAPGNATVRRACALVAGPRAPVTLSPVTVTVTPSLSPRAGRLPLAHPRRDGPLEMAAVGRHEGDQHPDGVRRRGVAVAEGPAFGAHV